MVWLLVACGSAPHGTVRPSPAGGGDDSAGETDAPSGETDTVTDSPEDTEPVDSGVEPDCEDYPTSDAPATQYCAYMDWNLDPVGYYKISTFGTSADSTTWGGTTSCGWLQEHYDYWGCREDANTGDCLDDDWHIPWVHGTVDYDYDTVMDLVDRYAPGDVPEPDYFYVAGAQRFGCGAVLRVTYPDNGRCVVVYAEDGGPNSLYEGSGYGERRILDSSPAVVGFLDVVHTGWANSDLVYVEWGHEGDTPGEACTPCLEEPVAAGTEDRRSPYDVAHLGLDCR